jgi:hypothetical protein
MKQKLLIVALSLLSAEALAQTSTSTSGAGSTAQVGVQASPSQSIQFNTGAGGTLRNVPSIFPPSFAPSTPCSSVVSGGVGVAGFGISLGGSVVDEDCNLRETARLLHLIGQADAALALICTNPKVSATSPQLCKRSDYVASRPADYISSERPIMPPAPVAIQKPAEPAPSSPAVGALGYGTDGKVYKYDGAAWNPVQIQSQAAVAVDVAKEKSLQSPAK